VDVVPEMGLGLRSRFVGRVGRLRRHHTFGLSGAPWSRCAKALRPLRIVAGKRLRHPEALRSSRPPRPATTCRCRQSPAPDEGLGTSAGPGTSGHAEQAGRPRGALPARPPAEKLVAPMDLRCPFAGVAFGPWMLIVR
jgi:hypothetical protein